MVTVGIPRIFTLAFILGIVLGIISLFVSVQLLPQPCWPSYLQSNYSLIPPIVFGILGLAALFVIRDNKKEKLFRAVVAFLILFIFINFFPYLFLNTGSYCGQILIGERGFTFGNWGLNASGQFAISEIMQNSTGALYNLAIACTILTPNSYQNIQPYPLFIYANGSVSSTLANGKNTIPNSFNLVSGTWKNLSESQCYWANGTVAYNLQLGTAAYGFFYIGYTTKNGAISSNNLWNFEKAGEFGVKVI